MSSINPPDGVQILGEVTDEYAEILTTEALEFVAKLAREFGPRRQELLRKRTERAAELEAGKKPDRGYHFYWLGSGAGRRPQRVGVLRQQSCAARHGAGIARGMRPQPYPGVYDQPRYGAQRFFPGTLVCAGRCAGKRHYP